MDKQKIIVIDGHSLMYRAFYGIHLLTTRRGVYTNAVYGFTNMLLNLIEDYNPSFIAVAFDKKGPTFRHEIYDDYKARRQKPPEELSPQFDLLKELLSAMDIPSFEMSGFEADDILGSFSKLAEDKDAFTYLVTGDRDALQLVSDNTTLLFNVRGTTNMDVYDVDKIREIYDLSPDQMIDLKALMGDQSDNIPGVPGVGEKTGLKLLHEYGSLEEVYENLDEISGKKLKENLTNYKEQALLSRELATIIKDVPDLSWPDNSDKTYNIPRTKELYEVLKDLEFNTIIDKLDFSDDYKAKEKTLRKKEVIELNSLKDLEDVLDKTKDKKEIALIVEEDIFSFAFEDDKAYSFKAFQDLLGEGIDYFDALAAFKEILSSEDIKKIVHDGKKLMLELFKLNMDLNNLGFDSYIAAYLLDSTHSRYDIKYLLYEYLEVDTERPDGADLLLLSKELKVRLKEQGMYDLYHDIEHPLISILADMELTGFKVNKDILKELSKEFSIIIDRLTLSIHDKAGEDFNINSPKQLGVILFEKLELPIIKRTKTGYSTAQDVLEQLKGKHEIIDDIMEYRQVMKLKSTYVDGLLAVIDPDDGKIHSSFNQTITSTGRISSTEPNLQNIPIRLEMGRRIRKVFVPSSSDYILVDADYSQIELRVLAHISADPTFVQAFIMGEDIHRRTASEILGISLDEVTEEERDDAKAVNFGIVYGISDFGLAKNIGVSRSKANSYIENYLSRYPGIKNYMDNIIKSGKDKGYVETLMGRRRNLPELKSRNFNIRSFGERVALNTPIQGTAADIIKKAMKDVHFELKSRKMKSKLILQVHDELVIDTYKPELDEVKDILREKMEGAMELLVPLTVDIKVGESWYDVE